MSDTFTEVRYADKDIGAQRRALWITVTGNFLEWFDWTIYAAFAPFIAKALFAPANPVSALLQTLAIFSVGFIARPVGGLVFGKFADTHGRRTALVVTMLLMAAGSLLIAFIPSYSKVGLAASALLLAARLVQGLAHGGESAAAYVYVGEIAPSASRGLWSSSFFSSITAGVILGSLLGVLLTQLLGTHDLLSWGWRIPFAFGAVLALYTFHLRRTAMESEVFRKTKKYAAEKTSSGTYSRAYFLSCLRMFVLLSATVVVYYTWLSFATSYAIVTKGIAEKSAFIASLGAQLICLLAMPLFGWLSDRVGRRPLALVTTLGFVLLSFPLDTIFTNSAWSLFMAQSVALVLFASVGSIYPALMSEQLATGGRGVGIGFVTSLSAAVFGGTAPYLNTWLSAIGSHWIFTAYTVGLNVLATIAILFMPETKGADLQTSGV
jgi:MHS family alpha-ketoglutarate permease-like MFS transporter